MEENIYMYVYIFMYKCCLNIFIINRLDSIQEEKNPRSEEEGLQRQPEKKQGDEEEGMMGNGGGSIHSHLLKYRLTLIVSLLYLIMELCLLLFSIVIRKTFLLHLCI